VEQALCNTRSKVALRSRAQNPDMLSVPAPPSQLPGRRHRLSGHRRRWLPVASGSAPRWRRRSPVLRP